MSDTTHRDEQETRELAPTATTAFADACEVAGQAMLDLHEHDQALETLAHIPLSATAMLNLNTRSGGTQELPAGLRPMDAPSVEAPDAAATPSGEVAGKPRRRWVRRALAVIASVAVVAAAVAAFVVLVLPELMAEPDEAVVTEILAADPDIMDGFAVNDYVQETPYELSDVTVTGLTKGDDGAFTVDATATVVNESFESDVTATLLIARADDKDRFPDLAHAQEDASGWAGTVLQATASTKAIAGVTFDPAFPEGFAPTFDAAAQTCTFTASTEYSFWFGADTVSTPVTYAFDGNAWLRSEGERTSTVTYDGTALQGDYAPTDVDAASVASFTISNFDPATNTFAVEYRAVAPGLGSSAVSGVISCSISPAEPGDTTGGYVQVDGAVYTFAGEGSSSGGEGTAYLQGVVGLDGTLVISLTCDYTRRPLLFGEPTNETMEIAGTLMHS